MSEDRHRIWNAEGVQPTMMSVGIRYVCLGVLITRAEIRICPCEMKTNSLSRRVFSVLESLGKSLNHDFCPSANRYVYWLKKPIGWVVSAAFFSFLVGLVIGPQGFVLMWSFLALMVIGFVWPWLSMKGISCELNFASPRSVEFSDTTAVLRVTNRWPISIFGLMIEGDFLQDLITEDDEVAVGLQRIPGWSVSTYKWVIKPDKRGILPSSVPSISNGFPFGLCQSKKDVQVKGQTIVWPECEDLKGVPEIAGAQFNVSGIVSDRAGVDGDVIGVRNYRQGDSLRHIHWAKTAQRNRLIVQERQSFASRPYQIFVDLTPQTHCGVGGQSSYEWAIRIAGSICKQLHLHQSHVALTCIGLPLGVASRVSNEKGLKKLLDFLAMVPAIHQLETAIKNCEHESLSVQPVADPNAKTFLIRTIKSDSLSQLGSRAGVKEVIIDVTKFESNGSVFEDNTSPQEVSGKAINISTPDQAADELSSGWEEGIGYVA